jgi:hypothetical protein
MSSASSPEGSCPSLEELAAYIDRRLDSGEEARVAEHIASCERCLEIYAGSLEYLADEGGEEKREEPPEPSPARVRPQAPTVLTPSRSAGGRRVQKWLSLAAALVIGAVGLQTWRIAYGAPSASEYSAAIGDLTKAIPFVEGLPTNRGEGDDDDSDSRDRSFQAGALLVDIEVVLDAPSTTARRGKIQDLAGDLLTVLQAEYTSDPRYEKLLEGLRNPQIKPSPEDFEALRDLIQELPSNSSFRPRDLELGIWAEAGRLAARNGRASFFLGLRGSSRLRFLDRQLEEPARFSDDELIALKDLRKAWPKSPQDPLDSMIEAFESLVGLHGIDAGGYFDLAPPSPTAPPQPEK